MLWKKDKKSESQRRMHHALLPHEFMHSIYHRSFELFEELFTGGPDNLREWWDQASAGGGTWIERHPVVHHQPDPCKRIPFGIHGDDAGAQGEETVLVVTWGGVAISLPTLAIPAGLLYLRLVS